MRTMVAVPSQVYEITYEIRNPLPRHPQPSQSESQDWSVAKNLRVLTGFAYSALKNSIKLGIEISSTGRACTFYYVCIKIMDVFAHRWRQPSIMQGVVDRTSQNDLFHFHTFTLISLKSFFS